ncbi:hypothetical protein F2Q70_00033897 [Brassica cretica]|uniref:Uncharacterized protein n=1 Tax=Brassica cretica TaxID=69181 RepID=A0A8S9GBM8_BRACR|nr:hypothetical protein F2Q68_00028812 [Brassica cretica]KAF2586083.1 hypothetical protein F2Q70_00033897 [Brassica cretica]
METDQLDSDSHLPPRKRLLAEFKKLNGSSSSSSSSTSNSNRSSSSASTDVYTHLDDLLASRFNNDQNKSPEELAEAARSAAASAVKAAKTARAVANEKALISAKAIAAAKRALELVDSFPKEAMSDCKERSPKKNKQRKHVPLHHLYYSKGEFRDEEEEEEDLALRLHRAVDKRHTTKVLGTRSSFEENGQINKKQKTVDVAGVVDSIPTPGKEESNSLGRRRRGRVKLKKLSLSIL